MRSDESSVGFRLSVTVDQRSPFVVGPLVMMEGRKKAEMRGVRVYG